ncbi:MAG: carbohydrate-binding protein [Sedimentisphaerales bacterium]|nr:carbohydrate-binding protein [Sedimentisphaerales bacterium]
MYKIFLLFIVILVCNTISPAKSYLAETVNGMSGCVLEREHTGDGSEKYVNMGGRGSWLEWDNITAKGSRYLIFTFANGSQSECSSLVQVNGVTVANLLFPSTTSWQAKGKQVAYEIDLPQEVNKVRLLADAAAGGPNIYQLEVVEDYYAGAWRKVPEILKAIVPPVFPDRDFNITDYGAIGDGKIDCYCAFKTAIEACNKAGGGRVVVPEGTYLVEGPVHLKANVNLHFAAQGSIIKFSTNRERFLVGDNEHNGCVLVSWEGTTIYNYSPALYAYNADNIAVTGLGTIDHQGEKTWQPMRNKQQADRLLTREWNNNGTPLEQRIMGAGHNIRAHLLQFYNCDNILIEDVTFKDAGFWVVHPVLANNVTVRRIKFEDCFNLNNDGVDPEFCSNVHIHDIDFGNGDDNIAIKAGRDLDGLAFSSQGHHSQNIVIQNCRFKGHNAVCIGSEASGSVYDVYIENNTYCGNVRQAIYIKTNRDRGGEYRRIYLRNSVFKGVEKGIYITTDYKGENTYNRTPFIGDVYLENIFIDSTESDAICMLGLPMKPFVNINLDSVFISNAAQPESIKYVDSLNADNLWINGRQKKISDK